MYIAVSTLFTLIRQFFLPNPFEVVAPGITIMVKEIPFLLTPEILNLATEGMLHGLTFAVVRLYYKEGTEPLRGCILYMFFFVMHSKLIECALSCYPQYWLMGLIWVGYIIIHIALKLLINKLDSIYIP